MEFVGYFIGTIVAKNVERQMSFSTTTRRVVCGVLKQKQKRGKMIYRWRPISTCAAWQI
jgi:hypothetical protein